MDIGGGAGPDNSGIGRVIEGARGRRGSGGGMSVDMGNASTGVGGGAEGDGVAGVGVKEDGEIGTVDVGAFRELVYTLLDVVRWCALW